MAKAAEETRSTQIRPVMHQNVQTQEEGKSKREMRKKINMAYAKGK